jgi:Rieske Fe-S protein
MCGSLALTVLESCGEKKSASGEKAPPQKVVINLSTDPELGTIPCAVKRIYDGVNETRTIIIIRNGEKDFVVLPGQCTHKGVELRLPKEGVIKCPAHGSMFKPDGSLIGGKATVSLTPVPFKFDPQKNELTIG